MIADPLWDRVSQREVSRDSDVAFPPGWLVSRGPGGTEPLVRVGRWLTWSSSAAGRLAVGEDRSAIDATEITLGVARHILDRGYALVALTQVPGLEDGVLEKVAPFLKSLAAVLREPAAYLTRSPELRWLPASGRVTHKTVARLASHSEDWERVRLDGIQARRVLLEKLEENYDLHENRILVDALVLLENAAAIQSKLTKSAADVNAEARHLSRITHRARTRISHALGGLGDLELMQDRLGEAEKRVRKINGLLVRAKDNPPAAVLGWRRHTEPIEQTNLFTADPRYADIARMATILRDEDGGENLEVQIARQQRLFRAWDAYLLAVTRLAVDQLNQVRRGFDAPIVDEDGVVSVARAGRRVRLVAVPEGYDAVLEYLEENPADQNPETADDLILVAVGRPASRTLRQSGRLTVVRMGPFALQSIEMIQASLRWHLQAKQLLDYPRTVTASPRLQDVIGSVTSDGCHLLMRGKLVTVDSWSMDPSLTRSKVMAKVQELRNDARAPVLGWDEDEIEALLEALEWTYHLRFCPVCDAFQGASYGWHSDIRPDGTGLFNVKCSFRSCGIRWGLYRCSDHRVPRINHSDDDDLEPTGDSWSPPQCAFCGAE